MRGDPKPQDLPPAMAHDQQAVERTKGDCRHHEKIHRGDTVSVVTNERLPALRRRGPPPRHILGHAGLADLDAQLEQLAIDRGAPHSGLAMLISRISLRISGAT